MAEHWLLFLDESGAPAMTKASIANQPWLTLAGFFVKAGDWRAVHDSLTEFKKKWLSPYRSDWPHVELHTSEFGRTRPWTDIYKAGDWPAFDLALRDFIAGLPITTLSATIDKAAHGKRYLSPLDPYELAYEFVIERFDLHIRGRGLGMVILDPRSPGGSGASDHRIRLVHEKLRMARSSLIEDPFFPASHLSPGIQVADACAWAVRMHFSQARLGKPEPAAYEAVLAKYRRGPKGEVTGFGEKLFP